MAHTGRRELTQREVDLRRNFDCVICGTALTYAEWSNVRLETYYNLQVGWNYVRKQVSFYRCTDCKELQGQAVKEQVHRLTMENNLIPVTEKIEPELHELIYRQ